MSTDRSPFLFLVDDEPDQVFLVELAAKRSGEFGRVRTAIDAQLAYQLLLETAEDHAERPDLILIDWKMPRMHGSELAAALNAHEILRDIPLIALSNSSHEADREQALEAGCRAFLPKQDSFEQLIALLKQIRQHYCPPGVASNQSATDPSSEL